MHSRTFRNTFIVIYLAYALDGVAHANGSNEMLNTLITMKCLVYKNARVAEQKKIVDKKNRIYKQKIKELANKYKEASKSGNMGSKKNIMGNFIFVSTSYLKFYKSSLSLTIEQLKTSKYLLITTQNIITGTKIGTLRNMQRLSEIKKKKILVDKAIDKLHRILTEMSGILKSERGML